MFHLTHADCTRRGMHTFERHFMGDWQQVRIHRFIILIIIIIVSILRLPSPAQYGSTAKPSVS